MSANIQEEFQAVRLSGRLDASTGPAQEALILSVIDGGVRKLLLDCADLQYVSSAGLRVVLAVVKRMKAVNGQLALCAPSEPVAEVFKISGYDTILEIFPDREAATARLMSR
jgi:anti-anti-sigma factor